MSDTHPLPWKNVLLMAAAFLLYLGGFVLFNALYGIGRGFFILFPVFTAAWLYGVRGGLLVGVLAIPCN